MPEETRPNKLPAMTAAKAQERAQRILDLRGEPPYTADGVYSMTPDNPNEPRWQPLTQDEVAVLSEFVCYWRPFLKVK